MLNIVDSTVPGMQLHSTDLNQPEQSGQVVDPEARALSAFTLFDVQFVHGPWDRRQWPLMVERGSSRMPDELQWPARDVPERLWSHLLPVPGELRLGGNNGVGKKLQNVFPGYTRLGVPGRFRLRN